MELFSHRKGLKPLRSILQVDSIDDGLRNRLWDGLKLHYWDRMTAQFLSQAKYGTEAEVRQLVHAIWHRYFKRPLDTIPPIWSDTYKTIRKAFFDGSWNEVYDFIEFVAANYTDDQVNTGFTSFSNTILQQEMSAYRFVNGRITEITSDNEITEIETALAVPDSLSPVREHLQSALDKLSDRKAPDYRNSIKESISAVEALSKILTSDPKATLGDALKKLETVIKLHPALKAAFSSLYGYTSDADGIRHALLDEASLSFEDAKFMLVSCSAFTNYVVGKASKSGLKL